MSRSRSVTVLSVSIKAFLVLNPSAAIADDVMTVKPVALGAPYPSEPVTAPVNRNAFPADILGRMRLGLIAQQNDPKAAPAATPADTSKPKNDG